MGQTFVFAALLFSWCKADAHLRGINPPRGAPMLVGLFAIIGVPYYYFRTRPWRTALWHCVKAAGFILAIALCGGIARVISTHASR